VRPLLTTLVAVSLSACAGGKQPAGTPDVPAPAATPAPIEAAPAPPAPVISAPPTTPRALETVTGTVTYRLRIALTPEAVVQVELRDVSRQDVEAPLIAKQVITRPGQVPVTFALDYDPEAILPGHLYAVSARIEDRGQLAFVTDAPVPVITGGAPTSAEIIVAPLR
jgi:putative lipoprotein